MVRLSTVLDKGIEIPALCNEREEERVQSIARRILAGSLHYQPVLEKFCS
jgi:hypothetical protein